MYQLPRGLGSLLPTQKGQKPNNFENPNRGVRGGAPSVRFFLLFFLLLLSRALSASTFIRLLSRPAASKGWLPAAASVEAR